MPFKEFLDYLQQYRENKPSGSPHHRKLVRETIEKLDKHLSPKMYAVEVPLGGYLCDIVLTTNRECYIVEVKGGKTPKGAYKQLGKAYNFLKKQFDVIPKRVIEDRKRTIIISPKLEDLLREFQNRDKALENLQNKNER